MPPEGGTEDLPPAEIRELLGKQVDRYQAIVTRLANNGLQVKTWCVTALAAVVAIAANGDLPELLLVALVVLATFCLLDAYYLSLERHFREESARLVNRASTLSAEDWTALFQVEGPGGSRRWGRVLACASSLAISPFYVGVGLVLLVGSLVTI